MLLRPYVIGVSFVSAQKGKRIKTNPQNVRIIPNVHIDQTEQRHLCVYDPINSEKKEAGLGFNIKP